jgi:dTDP-4-dehydrorhamnose reductase
MSRLLITGGSGYLGQHLVPAAADTFDTVYTYFTQDRPQLGNGYCIDLRDSHAVHRLISKIQPAIIVHLAGSNRSPDMESVIVQGTRNIVEEAAKINARLIHFSTDVLFDGRDGPYSETDRPNPIHAYGRAKATAEKFVTRYDNHVVIRTSLIYGLRLMDHSTEWVISSLKNEQPVVLFSDQIRNPVWTETLCQACLELVGLDFQGIINVAGNQALSRAEFGFKLLDWWGYDRRETLNVGTSDASWPRDCRLRLELAESLLSTPLLGVDQVLTGANGKA